MKLAQSILLLVAVLWSTCGEAQQLSEILQQQPQQQLSNQQELLQQHLPYQQVPQQQLLTYIRDMVPRETASYGRFVEGLRNCYYS